MNDDDDFLWWCPACDKWWDDYVVPTWRGCPDCETTVTDRKPL